MCHRLGALIAASLLVLTGAPSASTAIAAPASTAQAPSAAAQTQARAKLREGLAAMERGEHAKALSAFEAAYHLVPSPKVLFNQAMALAALGRHLEAAASFEGVLAAAGVPTDVAARARQQLAATERRLARLTVTSAVAAAELQIDGRITPLDQPTRVSPGRHQVSVSLGDRRAAAELTLAAGEERTLTLSPPEPAVPRVVTRPAPEPEVSPPAVVRIETPVAPVQRPTGTPLWKSPWFWTALGVVVVGTTAGVVVLGSSTKYPEADDVARFP